MEPQDENQINTQLLLKENVKKMDVSLTSLVNVLTEGFKCLKDIKDQNLIIVIGNTGCGKSTMLSSLLNGPESLEITSIDIVVKFIDPKTKEEKQKTKK